MNKYFKIIFLSFIFLIIVTPSVIFAENNKCQVTEVKVVELRDGIQVIIITDNSTKCTYFNLTDPVRLVVDIRNATHNLSQKTFLINKGTINKIRSSQYESGIVRVVIDLSQKTKYEISQKENQIIVSFSKFKEEELKELSEEELMGIGRKVSIDLPNTEITDILRIVGEQVGLNVITTPEVKGKITVRLKDVSAHKALDIILKTNGYSYGQIENIIVVRKAEEGRPKGELKEVISKVILLKRKKAADLKSTLAHMLSGKGEIKVIEETNSLVVKDYKENIKRIKETVKEIDLGEEIKLRTTTRIFPLEYIYAEDIRQTVERILSEQGKVEIDLETNSLIITDIPEKIEMVKSLIEEVDMEEVRPKRVSIEARILEVTYDAAKEIGTAWSFLEHTTESGFAFTSPTLYPLIVESGEIYTKGFYPAGFTAKTGAVDYLIARMRASIDATDFNVLSKPRVITVDGKEARIQVGKRIPITTPGAESGAPTTTFEEIGIILTVTPYVSKDKVITMDIHQEVSDITGYSPENQPIISTRDVRATVYVRDGGVIALGGLLRDSQSKSRIGIPGWSKIPLLGFFFRRTLTVNNKTELIIFLSPYILTEEEIAKEASREKELSKEEERIERKKKPEIEKTFEEIEAELLGKVKKEVAPEEEKEEMPFEKEVALKKPLKELTKEEIELATTLYGRGLKYMKEKDYDKTIETFKELIRNYPDFENAAEAQYFIGECYYNKEKGKGWGAYPLEKYKKTFEELRKILRRYRGSKQVSKAKNLLAACYRDVADMYYNEKNYPQAQENYKRIIRKYPKSKPAAYARYQSARCLEYQKQYEEAINEFLILPKKYSKSKWADNAYERAGALYALLGDMEKANATYRELLAKCPRGDMADDVQHYIAVNLYYAKKYKEALEEFNKLIKNYPESKRVSWAEEYIEKIHKMGIK